MLVPPPKWTVDEIPDLSGKVVIVTGGNANIGRETVKVSNTSSESKPIVLSVVKPKALLVHNAKVYLAARNEQKAMAVIDMLRQETGREALFLLLDLASLKSVQRAAEEFLRYVREVRA